MFIDLNKSRFFSCLRELGRRFVLELSVMGNIAEQSVHIMYY